MRIDASAGALRSNAKEEGMKQVNTEADVPTGANEGLDATGSKTEGALLAPDDAPKETTNAPYQDLLASWWTTAALAWGTPVRMWSEIVAAAWRPFLPPTALTAETRQPEGFSTDRPGRSDAPVPARPAPQAAIRAPQLEAPKRPMPRPARRPR
jgi:hypothetical protein